MQRFLAFLTHEFRLARTTIPIHVVAILEPVIMYALLTVILVHPTLDIYVTRSDNPKTTQLVEAMQTIASPIGLPYINPILIDLSEPNGIRQLITIEQIDSQQTAVQRFSLIDSNLVKNYRNRLTAASLVLWDDALGNQAVTVKQHPSMPEDIPYNTYFGMAMLSLAVMLASSLIGAVLTAQEFENSTIDEYRVAPVSAWWMLAARLTRLVISASIAAALLLLVNGWLNGYWPDNIGAVALILLPLSIIGGCLGIITGLVQKSTLPSFLITLILSFACWILGGSFKPAIAFGGAYEWFSRFTPNSYTINLLFPRFYGTQISSSGFSILVLSLLTVVMLALTIFIYNNRVTSAE